MGFFKWLRGEYDNEPKQQTESAPIESGPKTEESDQATNYEVFNNRFDYEKCYKVTGKIIKDGITELAEILLQRNKYFALVRDNCWLNVTGMRHHKMNYHPWTLIYGYVMIDKCSNNTLKVIDITGDILGYISKDNVEWVCKKYNLDEDNYALPYIGCTFEYRERTYGKINVVGNLEETKTGQMKDATDIMIDGALELFGNMIFHKLNDY